MTDSCKLNEGPFYQCCCNCKKHVRDFHHCTLDNGLREWSGNKCVCSAPKGWICIGMWIEDGGQGGMHSGWEEHSVGCEMYQPIKHYERPKEYHERTEP